MEMANEKAQNILYALPLLRLELIFFPKIFSNLKILSNQSRKGERKDNNNTVSSNKNYNCHLIFGMILRSYNLHSADSLYDITDQTLLFSLRYF